MPGRARPYNIGNSRDRRGRALIEAPTTAPGSGFLGTGTIVVPTIERAFDPVRGGIVRSSWLIDLTGLGSSTTDLDIIGTGTAAAYFARVRTAEHGTILGGRLECLEVPAGGVTDIDLYAAAEATGVFDGGIAALTETALVTAGGAWTLGLVKGIAPDGITDGLYLYFTGGAAGTAAAYTAGRFLLTLFGRVTA